jgi:hypothetical protein
MKNIKVAKFMQKTRKEKLWYKFRLYTHVHKTISIVKNIRHLRGTNKELRLYMELHQHIKKSIWSPNICFQNFCGVLQYGKLTTK